jgi:2-methylfumaryl-CoA isomerase
VTTRPAAVPVGTAARPLEGLRVIELSGYVAVPLCGLTLAQLGAEVIRVEPLGGANDRSRWPLSQTGSSHYWNGLNLGKEAIEVDLRTSEGQGLVADLVCAGGASGGILLSNTERYAPLSYAALSARRSDVIHVQLLGRRDGGTSVDYLAQAASGLPFITGRPGDDGAPSRPVNQVLPAWDIATGLYLATGLVAAERHRALTGEGQSVRIALEDAALSTLSTLGYYSEAHLDGVERTQIGNDVYGTTGRDIVTSDGVRIMIVVLTLRHWSDLLELTGLGETMARLERRVGGDFQCESDRFNHRELILPKVEAWFAERPWSEVSTALGRTKVLWKRYRSFREIVADDAAALRSNPLFHEIDQPGVGPVVSARMPLTMAGRDSMPTPAPAVGEHTTQVLSDVLGLDKSGVSKLAAAGVIGTDRVAESVAPHH